MKKKKKHSSIPFDLAKGKIAMREEMERKKKGEGKTKTVSEECYDQGFVKDRLMENNKLAGFSFR